MRANPWEVTKLEMWTPMAASLASGGVAARAESRFLDSGERFFESFSSARNDKSSFDETAAGSVQTPVRPGTRLVGMADEFDYAQSFAEAPRPKVPRLQRTVRKLTVLFRSG